jgi:hypothetical protein
MTYGYENGILSGFWITHTRRIIVGECPDNEKNITFMRWK